VDGRLVTVQPLLVPQESPPDPVTGKVVVGTAAAVLAVAAAHQAMQAGLRVATMKAILNVWYNVVFIDLSRSFVSGPQQRIYGYLSAAQETIAAEAATYVQHILAVQDIEISLPEVQSLNFAGLSSDGRDLEGLLVGAVVKAKEATRRGKSEAEAMAAGANYLNLVVGTQISDAGRAADQVALVVAGDDPSTASGKIVNTEGKHVRYGWVRMLTPPSCARCVILAGRFYKWNDGFLRHPMCWPAGTVVSGPEVLASSRRWYEGELVTIATQHGENLSVTANHPILTNRGWVPAKFVKEGDEVFRSTLSQGATPLMIPNHQQMPTCIENVFATLGVSRLFQVPASSEDFHGDGGDAEVDVVFSDRLLHNRRITSASQHLEEKYLTLAGKSPDLLNRMSASAEAFESVRRSATSVIGFESLRLPLIDAHFGSPHLASLGPATYGHICECKDLSYLGSTDSNGFADLKFAHAGRVIGDDYLGIEGDGPGARWDPSSDTRAMQDSSTDTRRAFDLKQRLSGQIEADRVIKITRVQWSGHVYSLTTTEGWVSSSNLITSNCDCRHIPVEEDVAGDLTTNPYLYFNSLTKKEQDEYFGVANSKAIRDGADVVQVINATQRWNPRTGNTALYTADGGRRYTTEGTSRRGFAGSRQRGKAKVKRPTPMQIYRDANGDQQAAIRLLKQFGYVVK
jgi:hypothetical protein